MMEKIDYTKLTGETLYEYFITDHHNKEYASIVALLPYALEWDIDKVYELFERSIKENKVLVAIYPGLEKTDTSTMEYIGSIPDGMLYLK